MATITLDLLHKEGLLKPRFMCLEGGGVNGIGAVGVFVVLEELGLLADLEGVAGTSAGSIIGLLWQAGYTAEELREKIWTTNFSSFMDDDTGFIRDAVRVLNEFGLYKGETFEDWLKESLAWKGFSPYVTFGEIQAATGRACRVVVTNLSKNRTEVYGTGLTDDMDVVTAVRASMSIPFFFVPVTTDSGDVLVDGGCTMNYPIQVWDVDYPESSVLGVRLDSRAEIGAAQDDWSAPTVAIPNIAIFGASVISVMRHAAHQTYLKKEDLARTIFVDTVGTQATDFNLKEEQKVALFESGKEAAEKWIRGLS